MVDKEFMLGQHQQAITLILESQGRMEGDIAFIKDALAEKRGERRVAAYLAGGVGAVVMMILGAIGKKLGITS